MDAHVNGGPERGDAAPAATVAFPVLIARAPEMRCLAIMVTNGKLVTMKRSSEKRVAAGEFKAKCLALLDKVEQHKQALVVTKRGRPVARVVPITPDTAHSLRGTLLHEE